MADREGTVGTRYEGGLDIDGMVVSVIVDISEVYDADGAAAQTVNIEVPALEPWFADRIMRAISSDYDDAES